MSRWTSLTGISLAVPFAIAIGSIGCGPAPLTCSDPVATTVNVDLTGPIMVDPAHPDLPVTIPVESLFQVNCGAPADKIEIASAALVEFDTEAKILDLPLRFAGGAEGTPVCDNGVGTTSKVKVLGDGLTNGALAPECNRQNLGVLTVIKRSGCSPTSPATRIAKSTAAVQCP